MADQQSLTPGHCDPDEGDSDLALCSGREMTIGSVIVIGSRFCAWRDVGENSSPRRAQRIKTGSPPLVQPDVRMWHFSDMAFVPGDVRSSGQTGNYPHSEYFAD
jgi:hypothetical protein